MQNLYLNANHSTNSHKLGAILGTSQPKKVHLIYANPLYVDLLGHHNAGLVLTKLVYWTENVLKKSPEKEGWFYKSERELGLELRLTRGYVRSAIRILAGLPFVSIWKGKGSRDNTTWFNIDLEGLEIALNGGISQKNLHLNPPTACFKSTSGWLAKPTLHARNTSLTKNITNKEAFLNDIEDVENVVVFDLKEEGKGKDTFRHEVNSSPKVEPESIPTNPCPSIAIEATESVKDAQSFVQKVQKRAAAVENVPKRTETYPKQAQQRAKTANPTISRLQAFGIAFALASDLVAAHGENRVKEVLSMATNKQLGAGWIIKALKEKWVFSGEQATGASERLCTYNEMLDYCNKNGLIGAGRQSKFTDYFEMVRASGQEKPLWRRKQVAGGASSTMQGAPSTTKSNFSHHTASPLNENAKGLRLVYSKNGGLESKYEA